VQPYPGRTHDQFAFIWYVIFFELFVLLVILCLLAVPRTLLRLKHVGMAFLAYVFVLVTLLIQSVLFFYRSDVATTTFGKGPIEATLAGLIILVLANAFSIISLGLLHDTHHHGYEDSLRRTRDDGAYTV
jgi:hypothetical protein